MTTGVSPHFWDTTIESENTHDEDRAPVEQRDGEVCPRGTTGGIVVPFAINGPSIQPFAYVGKSDPVSPQT